MDRLEGVVSRKRRLVLGIWVVLLLASIPFAMQQTKHLTAGGFEVPGSQSQAVSGAIKRFPGVQTEPLIFVFDNRRRDAAALNAAIAKAAAATRGVASVSLPPRNVAYARSQAGQPIVLLTLAVDGTTDETIDAAAKLRKKLDILHQDGAAVPIHLVGQQALWAGMQDLSKEDLQSAEEAGFPVVFIVLLIVFGSIAAALLPLSLGFVSVILTGAAIYFLSQAVEMSVFVTNMASMLGIGVAVDYSLFVLARFREEIHKGASHEQARRTAMRTSGLAVAFSGVTVLISVAGLFLVDSKTMHSMAIGAMVVVAFAILGAVTLLPALIALLGRRVAERGAIMRWVGARLAFLRRAPAPGAAPRTPFWTRWTATLMSRPVAFAVAATVAMLAIAIPALSLNWGTSAVAQFPASYETKVGVDLAGKALGVGAGGPIQIVADFGARPVDRAALARYEARVAQLPGVARPAPGHPAPVTSAISGDGHAAYVQVLSASNPEGGASWDLVKRLRAPAGPSRLLPGAAVDVGGAAAQDHDFSNLVSGSLWKVALFVMVLSYLILLLVLRSVILPLKAVLMNLLSVAAAYGVLVMFFQYGWFDGLTGYDARGFVNALTPPLLLAIVFGLSMDYEVFLLSRIKERYHETGDNRAAVAGGLADSAKTISSAAIIMVFVFAIFALTGLPQVKEIGVGLAAAIFLDATIVRLILVPSTMELLGDLNWWVPKWLDRILPNVDFESSGGAATPPDESSEPTLVAR